MNDSLKNPLENLAMKSVQKTLKKSRFRGFILDNNNDRYFSLIFLK